MSTPIQIKLIHTLKGALSLDNDTYRAILAGYGVASSKDLSLSKAGLLLKDLEEKAIAAGVWKNKQKKPAKAWQPPQNMAGGESRACSCRRSKRSSLSASSPGAMPTPSPSRCAWPIKSPG